MLERTKEEIRQSYMILLLIAVCMTMYACFQPPSQSFNRFVESAQGKYSVHKIDRQKTAIWAADGKPLK